MGINDANWRRSREIVGADPDDPAVCIVRTNGGAETRWAYEGMRIGSTQARAMRALLPAAPGDCASARTDFNQITASGAFQFDHRLCFRGIEALTVDGRPRPMAVFTTREEGQAGNVYVGERTIYFDTETRAVARSDLRVLRGNPTNNLDWQARQISTR